MKKRTKVNVPMRTVEKKGMGDGEGGTKRIWTIYFEAYRV